MKKVMILSLSCALGLSACGSSHFSLPKWLKKEQVEQVETAFQAVEPKFQQRTNLVVFKDERSDDYAHYAEEEGSYLWLPQETSDLSIVMDFKRDRDSITLQTVKGLEKARVGKKFKGSSQADDEYKDDEAFTVHFATDSFALSADAKRILDKAAKVYKKHNVVISAYADPRYRADYNLALSQKRANAVANYLRSKGVKIREARGYGEAEQLETYEKSRRANVVGE